MVTGARNVVHRSFGALQRGRARYLKKRENAMSLAHGSSPAAPGGVINSLTMSPCANVRPREATLQGKSDILCEPIGLTMSRRSKVRSREATL